LDIRFQSEKLRSICNDVTLRQRTFGERTSKVLGRRLDDFRAAGSLAHVAKLPAARCHELKGERVGQLAVDLDHLVDSSSSRRIRGRFATTAGWIGRKSRPSSASKSSTTTERSHGMVKNEYTPEEVSPPGETLTETLEAIGMTQAELARRTGRPLETINEIILGKTAITAETALQLERVLNVPAAFWNNREAQYREALCAEG